MTATHQLKSAVTSVAYAGRSLLLTTLSASSMSVDGVNPSDSLVDLMMVSLSNALLGMDANDPPKTLATMQLIGSLFSNVRTNIRSSSQLWLEPQEDYAYLSYLAAGYTGRDYGPVFTHARISFFRMA